MRSPGKTLISVFLLLGSWGLSAQQRWVEVRNEPYHHVVLENNYARLLNVLINPGDTTQYHRHNTPSVFIQLSNNKVGSQLLGGPAVISNNIFTHSLTFDSLNRERIHRVWNLDTVWMHVMDVEIIAKSPSRPIHHLAGPGLKLVFAEEKVIGYELSLETNKSFDLSQSKSPCLLVSLSEGAITLETSGSPGRFLLKPGHYFWIEQGELKKLVNADNRNLQFALLQF
jgi:quercetin dioxygenase-like cupin family protein